MTTQTINTHAKISINIWDDYYDDGYLPKDGIQETYAYVECELEDNDCKEVLSLLKDNIEKLVKTNSGLIMDLTFYDSSTVYPNLIGTEYEYSLYKRWQLNFKHLTHSVREKLVKDIKKLNLTYMNRPLDIYSES